MKKFSLASAAALAAAVVLGGCTGPGPSQTESSPRAARTSPGAAPAQPAGIPTLAEADLINAQNEEEQARHLGIPTPRVTAAPTDPLGSGPWKAAEEETAFRRSALAAHERFRGTTTLTLPETLRGSRYATVALTCSGVSWSLTNSTTTNPGRVGTFCGVEGRVGLLSVPLNGSSSVTIELTEATQEAWAAVAISNEPLGAWTDAPAPDVG